MKDVTKSAAETKAIAEEGYIYGLPIVMNYVVMHEYSVDTKGSQYKAPFKNAFIEGMKAGDENINRFLATGFKIVNGWGIGSFRRQRFLQRQLALACRRC
jgi:hypothetical protein